MLQGKALIRALPHTIQATNTVWSHDTTLHLPYMHCIFTFHPATPPACPTCTSHSTNHTHLETPTALQLLCKLHNKYQHSHQPVSNMGRQQHSGRPKQPPHPRLLRIRGGSTEKQAPHVVLQLLGSRQPCMLHAATDTKAGSQTIIRSPPPPPPPCSNTECNASIILHQQSRATAGPAGRPSSHQCIRLLPIYASGSLLLRLLSRLLHDQLVYRHTVSGAPCRNLRDHQGGSLLLLLQAPESASSHGHTLVQLEFGLQSSAATHTCQAPAATAGARTRPWFRARPI